MQRDYFDQDQFNLLDYNNNNNNNNNNNSPGNYHINEYLLRYIYCLKLTRILLLIY